MKILYADAKNMWHNLTERVLIPRGVEIIHVYSLKDVLNKINSENPEVAVINVSLKNGKAYEIIPGVLSAGVPVILIGFKSEGLDEDKAKELGVKFILRKPFTVDELFRTINEARLEKPKIKEEAKVPAIIHGGGIKESVEDNKEKEEIVELVPIEEPGEEVQLMESESLHVPDEDTLDIVPIESEDGQGLIEIESLGEENREIISEKDKDNVSAIESEDDREALAKAFGLVSESSENEKSVFEESVGKEESISPATQEVEKSEIVADSYLSAKEIEKLKESIKEQLIKEVKSEIKEEIQAVIWEVIPDMAEKVIREEIEKFIKSRLV